MRVERIGADVVQDLLEVLGPAVPVGVPGVYDVELDDREGLGS